jgi:tetratricopeptide (TPR) repeat protein
MPRAILLSLGLAGAATGLLTFDAHAQGRYQPQAAASRHYEQGESLLRAADAERAEGKAADATARYLEAAAAFQRAFEGDAAFVDAYAKYGRALYSAGRPADAVQRLEAGLAAHPESLELSFWLGNVLVAAGRADEGVGRLERVVGASEAFPEASLVLGNHAYKQNDFARAAGHLATYVKARPDDVNARGTLGNAYFRLERYGDARGEFEAVERQSPGNIQVLVNLGNCHAQLGEYARAVEVLQKALQKDPSRESITFNLGQAYFQWGKWAEAARWFSDYTKRQPEAFNGHYFLGSALFEQGRDDDALAALTAAKQRKPDVAIVHYKLGQVNLRKGALEAAETALAEAGRLAPTDAWVLSAQGTLARRRGQFEQAVALHERAVERVGDKARLHANLALSRAAAGRLDAAEAALDRAIGLDAQDTFVRASAAHIWTRRAQALLLTADPVGAEQRLRRVLGLAPTDTTARANLVVALVALGRPAVALTEVDAALAAAPDAASLLEARGRALMALGRVRDALEPLAAAQARAPGPTHAASLAAALLADGQVERAFATLAPFERAKAGESTAPAVVRALGSAHLLRAAVELKANAQRGPTEAAVESLRFARKHEAALDAGGRARLEYLELIVALRKQDAGDAAAQLGRIPGLDAAALDVKEVPSGHLETLQATAHLLGRREDKAVAVLEKTRGAKQKGSVEARLLRRAYERLAERAFANGGLAEAGRWLKAANGLGRDAIVDHNLSALELKTAKVRGKLEGRFRALTNQVPEAWFNLALVLDAQGKPEEAYRAWTRYAQTGGPHAARARELAEARRRVLGIEP